MFLKITVYGDNIEINVFDVYTFLTVENLKIRHTDHPWLRMMMMWMINFKMYKIQCLSYHIVFLALYTYTDIWHYLIKLYSNILRKHFFNLF